MYLVNCNYCILPWTSSELGGWRPSPHPGPYFSVTYITKLTTMKISKANKIFFTVLVESLMLTTYQSKLLRVNKECMFRI